MFDFDDVTVIDLNVARSTAAGELAAQLAMGIRWEPYLSTLRRKCAIIDAMTLSERTGFFSGIPIDRIDEIADTAGVDRADVVSLLNGYTILAEAVAEELLCHCTHATMLAGRCPWCGDEVFGTSFPELEEVCIAPPPCTN